jgi:hypothetical protein
MMGCRKEVSCRNLFRNLNIISSKSQYILSLIIFIIKNKSQFTVNSDIHNISTRQHTNLHQPTSNLTGYRKGIYYSGIRVYNNLPLHIKQLSDDPKNFELQLKKFCTSTPSIHWRSISNIKWNSKQEITNISKREMLPVLKYTIVFWAVFRNISIWAILDCSACNTHFVKLFCYTVSYSCITF